MGTKVIAHRGAKIEAPENSMTAFRRSIEVGADMIELDVRLSKDGVVVVMHDATVDRTSDGTGAIADLTWSELQRVALKADQAPGEPLRIPELSEVLALARGVIGLNVEIKQPPHSAEQLTDSVLAAIDASQFPLDRLIISSFDLRILEHIDGRRGDLQLAPLFSKAPDAVDGLPGRWLHLKHSDVDGELVKKVRAAGRGLNVWTVNEQGEQERLLDLGVDGIITDDPRGLRSLIAARGRS